MPLVPLDSVDLSSATPDTTPLTEPSAPAADVPAFNQSGTVFAIPPLSAPPNNNTGPLIPSKLVPAESVDPASLKIEGDFVPAESVDWSTAQTEGQRLAKLPRRELVREMAQAYMQGNVRPEDLKKFHEANEADPDKITRILDTAEEAKVEPFSSGIPALDTFVKGGRTAVDLASGAVGFDKGVAVNALEGLFSSTFKHINELSKGLFGYDAMLAQEAAGSGARVGGQLVSSGEKLDIAAGKPVSKLAEEYNKSVQNEQVQAWSNMSSAAKLNLIEMADQVRTFTERVVNKLIFAGQNFSPEAKKRLLREQMDRALAIELAKEGVKQGSSVFEFDPRTGTSPYDVKTDPTTVTEIQGSIFDPGQALIPGEAAVRAGTRSMSAFRALESLAPSVEKRIANAAGKALAVPFEAASKSILASGRYLEESPLLLGIAAAGGVNLAGGSSTENALAFILGAGSKGKVSIGKSAAKGLSETAQALRGQIAPGPIGTFVKQVGEAIGPEIRPMLSGQLAMLPIALGTGSEQEAQGMIAGGLGVHAGVRGITEGINGLHTARNIWSKDRSAPAERMLPAETGDPALDSAHLKVSKQLDNGDNNYVESVRKYVKKATGHDLVLLDGDDFATQLARLSGEGWGILAGKDQPLVPLTVENVATAMRQAGVVLGKVDPNTGQTKYVAINKATKQIPGISVGHEAGHLLELTMSPEEIAYTRRRTREAYSDAQLLAYHNRYNDLVDINRDRSADPTAVSQLTPAQLESTLSEIFAEHVNAVFNSLPIAQLIPDGSDPKKHRNYAREVYQFIDRGLERLGAKQPKLVDGSSVVKSGTGMELSSRLGKTIENVLQAKALDQKVIPGVADSVSVPGKGSITAPAAPSGGVPSPVSAPATGLTAVRPVEKAPIPAVKKGDPVGDLKDANGMLIGEDAVINKVLSGDRVEVIFVDPDTGTRMVGEMPVAELPVSKVTPTVTTVSPGPVSPITSTSPVGAIPLGERTQRPATAADIVAPKVVENVARPQAEAPPNLRTTRRQQDQFGNATPELVQQNTAALDEQLSKPKSQQTPVEVEYLAAASDEQGPSQATREAQRRAADAAEAAAQREGRPNPLRQLFSKLTVPYAWGNSKKSQILAWSADKVIRNVDLLRGWLELNPDAKRIVDANYLSSPQLGSDMLLYLENLAHGYKGDGTPVQIPADARPGTFTPTDTSFTPHVLPQEKVNLLNLLQGLEQPETVTPGLAYAQRMAELNGHEVFKTGDTFDPNPLRAQLRNEFGWNAGKERLLESAVERLNTNRIVAPITPRPESPFRAGDTAAVQAGFMPATPKLRLGKEQISDTGLPLGRPVMKGKDKIGYVQESMTGEGFEATRPDGSPVGLADTEIKAAKLLETAKVQEPVKALAPKQPQTELSPTAWILPDGTSAGISSNKNQNFANTGDFHSNWLVNNGKKWGLESGDRAKALEKGFVRLRLDGQSGRMGVEANRKFVKGAVLNKILDTVEANALRIGNLDINLFDDRGNVVVSESVPVFRLGEGEVREAVKSALQTKSTPVRGAYMPDATPDPEMRRLKLRAAVQTPDGKTYTGNIHYDALLKAADASEFIAQGFKNAQDVELSFENDPAVAGDLIESNRIRDGFVDESGKFYTREEATALVDKPYLRQLDSMDVPQNQRFMPAATYSWMKPSGETVPVEKTHGADAQKLFKTDTPMEAMELAWSRGWLRVANQGADLYVHTESGTPNAKQLAELKNIALESGKDRVVLDAGLDTKVLWTFDEDGPKYMPEPSPAQESAFKNSKVRDRNGKLLPLVHATGANFDRFAKGDIGYHFGTPEQALARLTDEGLYRELNEGPAARPGARTIPVFLNLENPLRMDDVGPWDHPEEVLDAIPRRVRKQLPDTVQKAVLEYKNWEDTYPGGTEEFKNEAPARKREALAAIREGLKDLGYDGIVYENKFEDKYAPSDSYIAFDNSQIVPAFSKDASARWMPANPLDSGTPGEQEGAVKATLSDFSGKNIKDILQKDDWAILTAHNRDAQKQTPEQNATQNAALEAELRKLGVEYAPVVGKYGNVEDSFAVVGLPASEVQRLVQQFGQESALTPKGLLYQDGSIQPATGVTVHKTPPADYFTTLPDGTTFTADIDFEAPRKHTLPEGSALRVLYGTGGLPIPKSERTTADVAKELKEAAIRFHGEVVTSDSITPAQRENITQQLVGEVKAALKDSGHAGTWYTDAVEDATAAAKEVYPELNDEAAARASKAGFANTKEAELALYTALAVTSQNNTVPLNTVFADTQFKHLLATGRFDPTLIHGAKAPAISANFEMVNTVLDKLGWSGMRELVNKDFTVRELSEKASELAGEKIVLAGRMNDVVQGSAIFGPKIGQGFLQNLLGNFDPVTVDLWLRRTWGRLTGDVLGAGITATRLARLIDAARERGIALPESIRSFRTVEVDGKSTLSARATERVEGDTTLHPDINAFAKQLFERWNENYSLLHPVTFTGADGVKGKTGGRITPEQYAQLMDGSLDLEGLASQIRTANNATARRWDALKNKPKGKGAKAEYFNRADEAAGRTVTLTNEEISSRKPEWAKAADVIVKQLKPIDAPTDQDRAVITSILADVQTRLEKEGISTTKADLQAILWYPEKDIWSVLAGKGRSKLKNSYDTEFLKLADQRGRGNEARAAVAALKAARESRGTGAARAGGENPQGETGQVRGLLDGAQVNGPKGRLADSAID